MFKSCLHKQSLIIKQFAICLTKDEKYAKIISIGSSRPTLSNTDKTADKLVSGCQSKTYLRTTIDPLTERITFEADSDALISNGLAALLTDVYSRENIEAILKCQPSYLQELGIPAILTPSRANGLANIFTKMQQDAFKLYHELIISRKN
jgi:cysteine desulfuration protein SufE